MVRDLMEELELRGLLTHQRELFLQQLRRTQLLASLPLIKMALHGTAVFAGHLLNERT